MNKYIILAAVVAISAVLAAPQVEVVESTTNVRTKTNTNGTGEIARVNSPTLITPALGTPTALVLTNATGLPVGSLSGLGTGVGTWLATPTFTNISTAVTGDTLAGSASTNTFTNKTLDANGTGNVFKWIEEIHLGGPQIDGTGAVLDALPTSATYGRPIFSGTLDKATNYAIYRFTVPFDFDANTDLAALVKFRLGAADTGLHSYLLSMASVADSSGADAPTFINSVTLNFAGDGSGASGDIGSVGYTTLTSWKASLSASAGRILVVKLERDGDDGTNDTSTVSSAIIDLTIKIGHSQ